MIRAAETLARVPLFRSLDEEAVRRLDTVCTWRRVGARQWVLDHQSGGTDLFFVLRGHVRVTVAVTNRDLILRDLRDGEFFGELAAIDWRPRSASILTVTETTVAKMPAGVFRRVMHEHPDVCDQVLQVLADRFRALANRANEQATFSARQRLYAELLRLARAPASGGDPIVSPPPTHTELAARISSNRAAVTRELNVLDRGKLIERRRGAIVLLDVGRLHRMVADSNED